MDISQPGKKAQPLIVYLRRSGVYLGLVSLVAGLALWELTARYGGFTAYILPSPVQVWERFSLTLIGESHFRRATPGTTGYCWLTYRQVMAAV